MLNSTRIDLIHVTIDSNLCTFSNLLSIYPTYSINFENLTFLNNNLTGGIVLNIHPGLVLLHPLNEGEINFTSNMLYSSQFIMVADSLTKFSDWN
jgi:hypothetical protein